MNAKGSSSKLSPEIRSWIDNCIVPILVKEYLTEMKMETKLAVGSRSVAQFATDGTTPSEVVQ